MLGCHAGVPLADKAEHYIVLAYLGLGYSHETYIRYH